MKTTLDQLHNEVKSAWLKACEADGIEPTSSFVVFTNTTEAAAIHVRKRRRQVNPIPFVKTDGGKVAAGFTAETRDCTVRSLALAAGISYADAHRICRAAGRQPRTGLRDIEICYAAKAAAKEFGFHVEEIPRPKNAAFNYGNFTTKHGSFAEVQRKYNKGRYLLTSGRHAFTIIDGVLHDSWHVGPRTRVGLILKFSSPEPAAVPAITQPQINELWARLDALEARS